MAAAAQSANGSLCAWACHCRHRPRHAVPRGTAPSGLSRSHPRQPGLGLATWSDHALRCLGAHGFLKLAGEPSRDVDAGLSGAAEGQRGDVGGSTAGDELHLEVVVRYPGLLHFLRKEGESEMPDANETDNRDCTWDTFVEHLTASQWPFEALSPAPKRDVRQAIRSALAKLLPGALRVAGIVAFRADPESADSPSTARWLLLVGGELLEVQARGEGDERLVTVGFHSLRTAAIKSTAVYSQNNNRRAPLYLHRISVSGLIDKMTLQAAAGEGPGPEPEHVEHFLRAVLHSRKQLEV